MQCSAGSGTCCPAISLEMLLNPWPTVIGFGRHGYGVRVTIGTGTILAALVYGGIVWMMISHMVKHFDQTVRRLSGTGQAESESRKVESCSSTAPLTDQRA